MHKPTAGALFPAGIATLVALALPMYFDDYQLGVCALLGIYLSINLMWMLVLGTAGIISLATLAIVGAGAYVSGYLSVRHGWGWPPSLAAATLVGLLLGAVIAAPAIRLRGIYFALLTLGLVELFKVFVLDQAALGQSQGLYPIASFIPADQVGTRGAAEIAYYATLGLVLVSLLVYMLVDRGRLGLVLRTSRESEPFARALGVDVVRARLLVFLISSAMLGFVGGFYAAVYRGVSPGIFSFDLLLLLLAMVVVGGMTPWGVVIGTTLLVTVDQHWLDAGPARLIGIGVLMLMITIAFPNGLAGIPRQLRTWANEREEELDPDAPEQPDFATNAPVAP